LSVRCSTLEPERRRDGHRNGTLRSRQRPPEPPTAETLAFRKHYRRGAKEGMSNDPTSGRYRHFGGICRRACHGATTYSSGTADAQER
jgi:hypothetical protein